MIYYCLLYIIFHDNIIQIYIVFIYIYFIYFINLSGLRRRHGSRAGRSRSEEGVRHHPPLPEMRRRPEEQSRGRRRPGKAHRPDGRGGMKGTLRQQICMLTL